MGIRRVAELLLAMLLVSPIFCVEIDVSFCSMSMEDHSIETPLAVQPPTQFESFHKVKYDTVEEKITLSWRPRNSICGKR